MVPLELAEVASVSVAQEFFWRRLLSLALA
jgi:hypothetical protein